LMVVSVLLWCYYFRYMLSGRILASFHCLGVVDVASDMLNR